MKPSLVDRIDTALGGKRMIYHDLAMKLWPPGECNKAWNYQSNGGPPGCYMALSAGLRRGGYDVSFSNSGPSRVVSPRRIVVKNKPGKKAKAPKKTDCDKQKCPDCGAMFKVGAPHAMFCPARTCDFCGTSFGHVLDVYDSRTNPPQRKCDRCIEDDFNSQNEELADA